jgi:glycosyltransferase involved in cell wall biosynthesis
VNTNRIKKVAVFYAGARYWGGVETYLQNIFELTDSTKIKLILISLGDSELSKRLQKAGFSVVLVDFFWPNPLSFLGLIKKLREVEPDLLVGQGMVASFFMRLSTLILRIPNLITVHSDYKYDYSGFKKYLFVITFWFTRGLTGQYIAVSSFLKKETIKLGVTEEKIEVIYNGVADVAKQGRPNEGQVVIGSIARLHPKKGYHLLIEAAAEIRDLDWQMIIWGEGDERDRLQNMINKLNLQDRISLPGFTNNMADSLSKVDIYIQPSLEEGFGITVAEAMYASKLVVVTPAGSLPELITDGNTGLITKSITSEAIAIKLREAINDISRLQTLGKEARVQALKRFSLNTWINKIEKSYIEAAK